MEKQPDAADRRPYTTLKRLVRKAMPGRVVTERETILRLGPRVRPIYARLRILDVMGVRTENKARVPRAARSFLFVCFGNLMRSPLAEAIFRREVGRTQFVGFRIASAGLHAIPGTPAHAWAVAAASDLGLNLIEHRAQVVTPELISGSDVIFAMDYQNKAELLTLYPEHGRKIYMLGAYAAESAKSPEISDPYYGSLETTKDCCRTLELCIRNVMVDLVAPQKA